MSRHRFPVVAEVMVFIDTGADSVAQVRLKMPPGDMPNDAEVLAAVATALRAVRGQGHSKARVMTPDEVAQYVYRLTTGLSVAIDPSLGKWTGYTDEELAAEMQRQDEEGAAGDDEMEDEE